MDKERIYTMTEFLHMTPEQKKEIPIRWIGQGYGYKSSKNWEEMDMDELIYIPECAIEDDIPINAYSKEEFIAICNGDERYAKYLFEYCDWQSPYTAYEEIKTNDLYLKPSFTGEDDIKTVGDLKKIISNLPDDMPVFVGCEGYCDSAVCIIEHKGILIIKDDGVIEMGKDIIF